MSAIPAAPAAATDDFTRGYRAWMLFMLMLAARTLRADLDTVYQPARSAA